MNSLELNWLIPTVLQVIGLGIGLTCLGFGYEGAIQGKRSLIEAIEKGHLAKWIGLAGIIFSVGACLTRADWVTKAISILLTIILLGIAWTSEVANYASWKSAIKQKSTFKSIAKLVIRIWLVIFVLLILTWGINLGWHTYHLVSLVKSLPSDPTQIQTSRLVALMDSAAHDASAVKAVLSPVFPILHALRGIPIVGDYVGQVEPLVTFTDQLTQAGREITLGLEPLLIGPAFGETTLSLPERVSNAVEAGQAHFITASQEIELADQERSQIRAELLPSAIRPVYLKLDGKFGLLLAGVHLLQEATHILGADDAQSYLLLAQNRDELRATGGFISGIGEATIQNGKILSFELGDSYRIDDFSKGYPQPPEALHRFMLADYWVTRDANWSPDFPSSAQEAQTLYTLSTGKETQGVIAFNQLAIQKMLEIIGPVQVPGVDELVAAGNVINYMQQAWAPGVGEGLSEDWWVQRKDFMQELGNVIIAKVMSNDQPQQALALGKAIIELLERGQLLVYFNNPAAEAALETGGLSGGLHPGNGDFLYLVDSNVGFNKVDAVVQRSIKYRIDLSDINQPRSEVTISYQHTGSGEAACKQDSDYGSGIYTDMQARCYLDYWRLYVPKGTELLTSNAKAVPGDELLNGVGWSGAVESLEGEAGREVLAGLMMLPIGASSQISISYSQPPGMILQTDAQQLKYTLWVQVQPGLEGLPLQLEIQIPKQSWLQDPPAGWSALTADTWRWQGILEKSTEFTISIQTGPQP